MNHSHNVIPSSLFSFQFELMKTNTCFPSLADWKWCNSIIILNFQSKLHFIIVAAIYNDETHPCAICVILPTVWENVSFIMNLTLLCIFIGINLDMAR